MYRPVRWLALLFMLASLALVAAPAALASDQQGGNQATQTQTVGFPQNDNGNRCRDQFQKDDHGNRGNDPRNDNRDRCNDHRDNHGDRGNDHKDNHGDRHHGDRGNDQKHHDNNHSDRFQHSHH